MATVLFDNGQHRCIAYRQDSTEENGVVHRNQYLIVDNGRSALLDPGSTHSYQSLCAKMSKEISIKDLDYLLLSHEEPDVAGSLAKWLNVSNCKVYAPHAWASYLPHLSRGNKIQLLAERFISIIDEGMAIPVGNCCIAALPAHFLHAEGNFQFYDPVSKILFSGELGASTPLDDSIATTVKDFDQHKSQLQGLPRRYLPSGVSKLWAHMVRKLDIDWIVPHQGASFRGKEMIGRFIDWVENSESHVDLIKGDRGQSGLYRH